VVMCQSKWQIAKNENKKNKTNKENLWGSPFNEYDRERRIGCLCHLIQPAKNHVIPSMIQYTHLMAIINLPQRPICLLFKME
jgi:hypothetical protein